ncbi:MAG: class I SAM-dependent methyltransferase [Candidatus Diapherotrites archaeon]|nr:class I SAM-dependent methyltransferase [Candidatus Diapherotrites archaeon]
MEKLVNLAMRKLREKHPWLAKGMIGVMDGKVIEYGDAEYYAYILPEYKFGGLLDTERLEIWLKGHGRFSNALELACGGGRATRILAKYAEHVDAVDVSPSQLRYAKQNVESANVTFIHDNMMSFANASADRLADYDLILSFWGFFYAANDEFARTGKQKIVQRNPRRAFVRARKNLMNFFSKIGPEAKFLFFHVRSDTQEQRVYRQIIGTYCPVFMPPSRTPSEILLPQALSECGHRFNWLNVEGEVQYDTMEKALETNLNFHLRGFFNDKPELPVIYNVLRNELERYENEGKIHMQAGYIQIDSAED